MKKRIVIILLLSATLTACGSKEQVISAESESVVEESTSASSDVEEPLTQVDANYEEREITEDDKKVMDEFMKEYVHCYEFIHSTTGVTNVDVYIGSGESTGFYDSNDTYARACAFYDITNFFANNESGLSLHTFGNIHWVTRNELAQYLRFDDELAVTNAFNDGAPKDTHEVSLVDIYTYAPEFNVFVNKYYMHEEGDSEILGTEWYFLRNGSDSIASHFQNTCRLFEVDGTKYWLLVPNTYVTEGDAIYMLSSEEYGIYIGIDWDTVLKDVGTYKISNGKVPYVVVPYASVPEMKEGDFIKIEDYLKGYDDLLWESLCRDKGELKDLDELLVKYTQ